MPGGVPVRFRGGVVIWIFVAAMAFLAVGGSSVASSFPFREVAVGDSVPAATLTDYESKATVDLAGFHGHPFVILFWGADIPAKKRRSLQALNDLLAMRSFFEKRQVAVLTVDAQDDSSAVIDEVMAKVGKGFHVYLDPGQALYGKLGVFVMPAFLLVDGEGKVAAGMGYSHDLGERLQGEVEILLGEKNREQVEAELHPAAVAAKSPEAKKAEEHRNMGFVMLRRGMPAAAIPEFEEAIKLVPDDAASLIELGCLNLDAGKAAEAGRFLDKGLVLAPDSVPGQICQARLKAAGGALGDAVADLQGLLFRNSRNPELHYVLGTLFEKQGKMEQAAAEYRKGYEIQKEKDLLHVKE